MVNAVRSCACLFGILTLLVFSAGCTKPARMTVGETSPVPKREVGPAGVESTRVEPLLQHKVETSTGEEAVHLGGTGRSEERKRGNTRTQVEPIDPVGDELPFQSMPTSANSQYPVDPNTPAFEIALKFEPGETTYYTIENTFIDSGGVPPLLTFTTTVKDRRFVIQRVDAPTTQSSSTSSDRSSASVTWECDRYDVEEEGMKDNLAYDSLRLLYPPPRLRELGGIPGSVSTFLIDGVTGETSRVRTQLAPIEGTATRAKLSRTAAKAKLTVNTLKSLLDDLGSLYLPGSPKRVGEAWTVERRTTHRTFGVVTTVITCTLRSVRSEGDSEVANIDITSEISLRAKGRNSQPMPTSRPGRRVSKSGQSKNYRLDRKAFSGRVKLDLTHGLILEMDLNRELEFVADLDSSETSSMVSEIRKGERHDLRVRGSRTPPRHPKIVGGRKAPVIPPEEKRPARSGKQTSGRTGSTTQPTTGRSSRPRANRPTTSRPDRPYSRVPRGKANSQPAQSRTANKLKSTHPSEPRNTKTTTKPPKRRSHPTGFRGKQKYRPPKRTTTQQATSRGVSQVFAQGEWFSCSPFGLTVQSLGAGFRNTSIGENQCQNLFEQ